MNRGADRLVANRAAHVVILKSRRESRYEGGHALDGFGGRKGFQKFPCHHPLLNDVLNVHDRALARHRDRLLQAADLQFSIDRRCKVACELDAFPLDRAEAWQGECDGVDARPQVDDAIDPLLIGGDGTSLFDEGGTGSFHRHAG